MGKGRDKRRRKERSRKAKVLGKRSAVTNALPDDDSPGFDGPDALIGAPLKPRPVRGSGAIALPEPYGGEETFAEIKSARLSK